MFQQREAKCQGRDSSPTYRITVWASSGLELSDYLSLNPLPTKLLTAIIFTSYLIILSPGVFICKMG